MLADITLFRLIALIASFVVAYYLLRLVHRHKLSGFEFLIWCSLTLGVILLSVFPHIITVIFRYLTLSFNNRYDRLIGLAFIFIALSFVITFYYRNRMQRFREQFLASLQLNVVRDFVGRHGAEKGAHDLFIIIPAFNEEENLGHVLRRVPTEVCGLTSKIVVISDGSTDGTVEVAQEGGAWTAEHPINCGQGMALTSGYRCATVRRARYVVTLDGDGQYRPEEIERLLRPIMDGRADIVSGSRALGFYEQRFTRHHVIRSVGIHFFNFILTMMVGRKITDSASGFRAVRTECLQGLTFIQEQFHSSEFLIECLKHGLRFEEVPVSFLRRLSGTSKKPRPLQYGLRFFGTMLRTWIRK